MKNDWEKVFASGDLYKVEIGKAVLEEAGIPGVILNKRDSAYGAFGEIELYVNRDNVLQAVNILKKAFDE